MDKDIILYNINGKPIAFIQVSPMLIVYLMNGQAVAYLEYIGNSRSRIWGLNGVHLGWYDDIGIVYNSEALRIGFTKEKYNEIFDKKVSIKPRKQKEPIILPAFSLSNTKEDFKNFLKRGIK